VQSTPPAVSSACCFAGQSDKITQTLKDKFWPTLLAGYAVWPLAHVINFRFIPNSQRVLYINAVNVSCLVYHNAMYSYTCVSWLMCLSALDVPHLYCDIYCLFQAYLSCRWYRQFDLQSLAALSSLCQGLCVLQVCWNVFLCKLASSGPPDESRIKAAGRQQSGGKELKAEV